MFKTNCETTLVSQLFDTIDNHLKIIHLPMEQYQISIDNSDEDDLWISGHRSIFSSYGSHCPSLQHSQYNGFHWDLYENPNYHQLAFEHAASLSEWSMNLNSDDPPRTSWREIKSKSLSHSCSSSTNTSQSDSYSPNALPLYHLFQRTKSQQHPCHLYQNFSDKSICDSSSSSSNSYQIPKSRIKLKSPTTFSQIKSIKEQSKTNVDQCLQTSIIHPRSKSADRLSTNPSQSSSTTRQSLPDLDFLTYYAKENPTPLSTLSKHICIAMKTPLFQPLSSSKRNTCTIFYCTINNPSNRMFLQRPRSSKEVKHVKTSPTTKSADDNEIVSSVCSSSSSSGYFSNSSRPPLSPYPLKSCLKRTKTEELTKNILTSAVRSAQQSEDTSKYRRYSAPTTSSHPSNASDRTKTLSEHDLRAKKSVSFCNEIARRLITPSTSPRDRYDYFDFVPRESLTESPPNEFNLSEDDDENEEQLINFIENVPEDLTKPLPIKYESDKNLINIFANTILRILEIKCSDPKSYYLNNQTNHELDRILRQDLCSLLREILEDGLRQNTNSLFSKKINLWRLIELTTPTTNGRLNEAKIKAQVGLSTTTDSNEKFNSFIYQLLNLHELASWLTHFISQRTLLKTYYETWAFVLVNMNNDLFENISNQLEKLSPLSFRLKYTISLTNQRSILPKKFQVRTWLRDKKTQVKISPKQSPTLPNVTIRRKFPVTKRQ